MAARRPTTPPTELHTKIEGSFTTLSAVKMRNKVK